MPKYNTFEDYHRKHGPWKIWECKCGKKFQSIPGEWGWSHSRCEKCHTKHTKRVERYWRKINPDRWKTIQYSYRRNRRKKDPEWRQKEYKRWQEWVARHPERRREIARQSYHRNKVRYIERAGKELED